MILELVQNIAFLVALAVGLQVLAHRWEKGSFIYRLAAGCLFGIVGVAGMMTPMHFQQGVIYDGRSIVLSLAGLFGGPVVAAVAGVFCAAFRIYLGGVGVTAGVSVVITSSTLGAVLYHLRKRNERWVSPWRLLGFGVFVHLLMLLSQVLFLPGSDGLEVVRRIGLTVLVFYPLGFLVVAHVFLEGEQREQAIRSLRKSQERYRQLAENTEAIPWEYDIRQDRWTYVAPRSNGY
jgi:LytS/YehU family sensor histidine kinase